MGLYVVIIGYICAHEEGMLHRAVGPFTGKKEAIRWCKRFKKSADKNPYHKDGEEYTYCRIQKLRPNGIPNPKAYARHWLKLTDADEDIRGYRGVDEIEE